MKRLSIKGVLFGGIVDVASSLVFGIVFAILAIIFFHVFGRVPRKAVMGSPLFEAMSLLIGFAGSALGGFVSARLAGHDELLNGALASFLCVALGIYLWAGGVGHRSILSQLLLLIAGPIFSLLGGYLRLRQKRPSGLA
jgi:hypothetical protein